MAGGDEFDTEWEATSYNDCMVVNTSSNSNDTRVSHYTEWPQVVWHSICAPLALIFNLLVLYIAFRYIRLRDRLNQTFVITMTLGDLGATVVHMGTLSVRSRFPPPICFGYYALLWSFQQISVLSLLGLNVDKLLSLTKPLAYRARLTRRVVAAEVCVGLLVTVPISIISLVANIDGWLGPDWGYFDLSVCHIDIHPVNYAAIVVVYYILPSLASAFISLHIFYLVNVKFMKEMAVGKRNSAKFIAKGRGRRIFFVFSATIWSCVTFLPYRISVVIYTLYYWYCSPDPTICRCQFEWITGEMTQLLMFLVPLGALGDPLVTLITQFHYRQRLKKMLWAQKIGLAGLLTSVEATYDRREHPTLSRKLKNKKSRRQYTIDEQQISLVEPPNQHFPASNPH